MAMKKKPESYLGGMAGRAAQGIGGRRAQLDAAEREAVTGKKAPAMKSTPVPPRSPPRNNQRAPKYK